MIVIMISKINKNSLSATGDLQGPMEVNYVRYNDVYCNHEVIRLPKPSLTLVALELELAQI